MKHQRCDRNIYQNITLKGSKWSIIMHRQIARTQKEQNIYYKEIDNWVQTFFKPIFTSGKLLLDMSLLQSLPNWSKKERLIELTLITQNIINRPPPPRSANINRVSKLLRFTTYLWQGGVTFLKFQKQQLFFNLVHYCINYRGVLGH